MESYDTLRYFISIGSTVVMFALFVGVLLFLFRPGSKKVHEETSSMIFRNDDRPAAAKDAPRTDGRSDKQEAR